MYSNGNFQTPKLDDTIKLTFSVAYIDKAWLLQVR